MKAILALFIVLGSVIGPSAFADELIIHVITPKMRVNWKNPSALTRSSGIDSAGNDYAPIGHFAVELKCTNANRYGINHVLTGMERVNKAASRKTTIKEHLGLGSLFFTFPGALETAAASAYEVSQARKDKRLDDIVVPTSEARCDAMMEFLDQWIENGSYQVYGGGKDASAGQGAGCADFAMVLFRIATQMEPPTAWDVNISVPKSLVGDGQSNRVHLSELINRFHWAREGEPAFMYSIADTNLVTDWLRTQFTFRTSTYVYTAHLSQTSLSTTVMDPIPEQRAMYLPKPDWVPNLTHRYPTTKLPVTIWGGIAVP